MLFRLACHWLAKGQTKKAIAWYEKVLTMQPNHRQAAIHLSHLKQQRQWGEANALEKKHSGTLNLSGQRFFVAHRAGWSYALHALEPLHDPQGIGFDGYIEDSFLWRERQSGEATAPYKHPWVGFLHNPPVMPKWFYYRDSPRALFAQDNWLQSLESCLGLFTLSEYYARWLRQQTDIPVCSLIHPTDIPNEQFSFDRFLANSNKKIIQLGWWLRKLASIYQLPIPRDNPLGYEKIKLNPAFSLDAETQLQKLLAKQIEAENISFNPQLLDNTHNLSHLSNREYDRILSENIGFIHLYDTSANNAVIECIARATPLLVNPLPAIVEYLGENYPFYFNTLEEAGDKALDLNLIHRTHEYLKHCDTRQKLSAQYFLDSFQNTEVYRRVLELKA